MGIETVALAAGGSVIGSMIGANAAENAARMQSDATNRATDVSNAQFYQTREDQRPWLEVGGQSIRTIGDLLRSGAIFPNFRGENLSSEPGYQFRLNEGNKAIENAARARGMYMSPSTVKELMRYGQDYASGEYQNAYNRDMSNKTTKFNMLSGAAGTGQTAANTLATTGAQNAWTIGNLITAGANARGAAGIAGANAWSGGLSNVGNLYMQNQMMNRIFPQETPISRFAYNGYGRGGDYQYG